MNDTDHDIPVLTDVIEAPASSAVHATSAMHAATDVIPLEQIQEALSQRLIAELSLQVPVLIEAALREHLPLALGARLQAELLNTLTNALPIAAQAATSELSSTVAYELGVLLETRLQEEVRTAVANEIAALRTQL
ncbi:MAG: hypothetical protein EBZ75_10090 [Oxalobacteraceae bacterium]|nr:hypothetical protein [Oxalobacteraceae bacterium]